MIKKVYRNYYIRAFQLRSILSLKLGQKYYEIVFTFTDPCQYNKKDDSLIKIKKK